MSCICGQYAPQPAQETVDKMLAAMHPRAPHGMSRAADGPVRLGQAFLRTGSSPQELPNPLTLDGRVFLVADARIDAREDLIARLRSKGVAVAATAPHAELVLHAYHAFGDDFLENLTGDFALALWDAGRKRLICARDRLGVRPFYYAQAPGTFTFASDMRALLAAGVTAALDPVSVADFLMVGVCMEPQMTIYRDIRCLPPGWRADVDESGLHLRRYWTPRWDREVRFRKRSEYVDAFSEVFEAAVRDRLPDGPVAISLSGGMDSTSIAAVATTHLRHPASGYHVSAKSIEPEDDELAFTEIASQFLGMRLNVQHFGDFGLFSAVPDLKTAQPCPNAQLGMAADERSRMAANYEHVHFDGYYGDALFALSHDYFPDLLRAGRLVKFAAEAAHHVTHARSLRGMSLRRIWRKRESPVPGKPPVPGWINAGFARETHLQERWDEWWMTFQTSRDPVSQIARPWMHRFFEIAEILPLPVVTRYPFLDLRLVEFMSGVPNALRTDKILLRSAMRERLPDQILRRPKTGAPGDPVRKLVTSGNLRPWPRSGTLASWVNVESFDDACASYIQGWGEGSTWASWHVIQTMSWANWIEQLQEFNQ